jgi:hypothetical protein
VGGTIADTVLDLEGAYHQPGGGRSPRRRRNRRKLRIDAEASSSGECWENDDLMSCLRAGLGEPCHWPRLAVVAIRWQRSTVTLGDDLRNFRMGIPRQLATGFRGLRRVCHGTTRRAIRERDFHRAGR